jgi:hypothetical protein
MLARKDDDCVGFAQGVFAGVGVDGHTGYPDQDKTYSENGSANVKYFTQHPVNQHVSASRILYGVGGYTGHMRFRSLLHYPHAIGYCRKSAKGRISAILVFQYE